MEKLELKTELNYQKKYIEICLQECSEVEKPLYIKWLQHVNRLIEICVKRNRF